MHVSATAAPIRVGAPARINVQLEPNDNPGVYDFWLRAPGANTYPSRAFSAISMARGGNYSLDHQFGAAGRWTLGYRVRQQPVGNIARAVANPARRAPNPMPNEIPIEVFPDPDPIEIAQPVQVELLARIPPQTSDQALWTGIGTASRALTYNQFEQRAVFGGRPWFDTNGYEALRNAARLFVDSAGVSGSGGRESYVDTQRQRFVREPDAALDPQRLPLRRIPMVELIWNYWMEEGMLVQTLNHIVARFQNRRTPGGDALTRFDLNPLLPLRNLLWGFAEDEVHRLTIRRRAAEYEYEYGLRLVGRAIPRAGSLVERRSTFLEGFHSLLNAVQAYYVELDDKTRNADAFPLMNGLREVHLTLAHGAHNQFADLTTTARVEMLVMQWLLARREMHQFLGGPAMVPYEEPWMDRVDTMKQLQGWSDTSITHFYDLAVHGERILLSVRHGRWNEATRREEDAARWAMEFRPSVQRYIHAYRAVTGIDLTTTVDSTMPSTLIARRLRQRAARR